MPHLAQIDHVPENAWQPLTRFDLGHASFRYAIKDFYLTNPIARSSPTLKRCSAEILHGESFAEAAE